MRFMIMFKADTATEAAAPACKELPEMKKIIKELANAGTLISTEGLQPSSRGARVNLSAGKITVTDGPFTEAKELIAGFVLVEVNSKAQAVELSKRMLRIAGAGAAEIREVIATSVPETPVRETPVPAAT